MDTRNTTTNTPMESLMILAEQLSSYRDDRFAMPVRGRAFEISTENCATESGVVADLSITTSTIARSPKAAAKGHVALVVTDPGTHAWSPPIC